MKTIHNYGVYPSAHVADDHQLACARTGDDVSQLSHVCAIFACVRARSRCAPSSVYNRWYCMLATHSRPDQAVRACACVCGACMWHAPIK